jgi:SAM-dependent methyltransferase
MKELPNEIAATADFEFAALRAAQNYRRALLKLFQPHLHGRVIEIGAGVGQFTELLGKLPQIRHLLAIEPDSRFCAEFRKALPGQTLLEGIITSMPEPEPWNGIVSINVLEHIRDDEDELGNYFKLLREQRGKLCLFVPARQEIYAPMDQDVGHHRRYSRPELRKKLERAGFKPLQLHYFNFTGYFLWWLNFCVLKQRKFNVGSVQLFDRFIFPCTFGLESRVCWPPIGQSLVAVARADG